MFDSSKSEVIIYTTRVCPFCVRAKYILKDKNIKYKEIKVDNNPALRAEMAAIAGQRTVPQIWIDGHYVGGCTDLMAIERSGQLDGMLGRMIA